MKIRPIPISKPQKRFRESTAWLRGFVAGRGCIAPETKLSGVPVADIVGQLSVSTLYGTQDACPPYLKGRASLYGVTLRSGLRVVVTDAHQFLTPLGWLPLSRLSTGSLIAIGDASCEDWQRETDRDWKGNRSFRSRQGDALPSPWEVAYREMQQRLDTCCIDLGIAGCSDPSTASCLVQTRRQFDFGSHIAQSVGFEQPRLACYQELQERGRSARKTCQTDTFQRLYSRRTNRPLPIDSLSWHREGAPALCTFDKSFGRSSGAFQPARQSELTLGQMQQTHEPFESTQGNAVSAWDEIVSIKFERIGEFWDLHVPISNHYSAAGIWHHNSGKSKIGSIDILQRARPGEPWMAISPDNNMIRDTTLPTFIESAKFSGQYIDHVVSPTPRLWFWTRPDANGKFGKADVIFKGAEEPDKLRGPNKAGLWFDEASIITKAAFDVAIGCCRFRGRMGPVLATFTPRGFKHWTFESFYSQVDEASISIGGDGESVSRGLEWFKGKPFMARPNTYLVRCSTRDNPFAPPEYYTRIGANYSTTLAMQELEGDFIEISGLVFKREWLSKTVQIAPADACRVRYWDKAATADGGCYTVGLLMARDNQGIYYVEDVVRGQWSGNDRNQMILQTAKRDAFLHGGTVLTYIEQEGAFGKEVTDQLIVMLSEFPIYRDIVGGSRWKTKGAVRLPGDAKIQRAIPFAAQCEAGNIRLVSAPWNVDYCDELALFPEFAYADQVDASSGAYNMLQRVAPHSGGTAASRIIQSVGQSSFGQTVGSDGRDSVARWENLPWNQPDYDGSSY